MSSVEKFKAALKALSHALEFEKQARKDDFYYGGIAKAFEVAIEYAWKYFRAEVVASGLEAPSPRDAIKSAGKIGIIDDVEAWLEFLRIRNIAVHDYLGVTQDQYLASIQKFLVLARKVNSRKG